jgi:osmotically-inducible protein OsmY
MPDLALTPGPKVAGKRIPIPMVKNNRSTAASARNAQKTVARAAGTAPQAAASAVAGAARAAPQAAASAARAAGAAAQFAQNVAPRPWDESPRRSTVSRTVSRAPALTAAIAAGAGLQYLLDPADGRRRRRAFRDQTVAAGRHFARRGAQRARYAQGKAEGTVRAAASTPRPADDQTLADRVRSEIFRSPDAPKGDVTVGVVDAVVTLRGELTSPEVISRLVDDTRAVAGVRSVQNLLHTPATPAPTGGTA